MMDEKTYKKEIVRMWDSIRDDEYKGKGSCAGVYCEDCQLSSSDGCLSAEDIFEIYKIVEKWSKEHPPKKYKVSRLEYDILKIYIDSEYYGAFHGYSVLSEILKKGYFAGATSKTNIRDYFNNCEVVD